jgi:hypothetical protein
MKHRYVVFFIISFVLNIGFWYYIMAFCAVYSKTSLGWVYSGVINIGISYTVLQFLDPLTKTLVRSLVTRCERLM